MPANADPFPSRHDLSLYIHVPYCRVRCGYCAFSSRLLPAPGEPGGLGIYLPALLAEIAQWGQRLATPDGLARIATIFFGGGTPSLLPAETLIDILDALRQHFDLTATTEITTEANPESATPDFLRAARACGINRLSLGVQSLDDHFLRLLARPHTAAQARETIRNARNAGFTNLGLDLIWGLPGQTAEHWLGTLHQALSLQPDHLSCYGLSIEPGTPLERSLTSLPALPSEDDLERMYLEGGALLDEAGFEHYEISNHARPGRRCQHNLLGWKGQDYLGLGPAAVSTLYSLPTPQRWTNPTDPVQWATAVHAGHLHSDHFGPDHHSPAQLDPLTPEHIRQERLMLGLRTALGAPVSAFPQHGALISQLIQQGMAVLSGGQLRLTRTGMLVSSSVIEALVFE
jgi:oxygen-independent coproporphyrinogen-3 oxidase